MDFSSSAGALTKVHRRIQGYAAGELTGSHAGEVGDEEETAESMANEEYPLCTCACANCIQGGLEILLHQVIKIKG